MLTGTHSPFRELDVQAESHRGLCGLKGTSVESAQAEGLFGAPIAGASVGVSPVGAGRQFPALNVPQEP